MAFNTVLSESKPVDSVDDLADIAYDFLSHFVDLDRFELDKARMPESKVTSDLMSSGFLNRKTFLFLAMI